MMETSRVENTIKCPRCGGNLRYLMDDKSNVNLSISG